MADCCEDKSCALEQLRGRQSRTLKTVLGINAVMFFVVLAAGLYASSTALLAVLFLRSGFRVLSASVTAIRAVPKQA
jgi:hypothetical protein